MTVQKPMGPFKPRLVLPRAESLTVLEQLQLLAKMEKQRPTTWWADQMHRMISVAIKEQRRLVDVAVYAFLCGLAAGAIAAALLLA